MSDSPEAKVTLWTMAFWSVVFRLLDGFAEWACSKNSTCFQNLGLQWKANPSGRGDLSPSLIVHFFLPVPQLCLYGLLPVELLYRHGSVEHKTSS